MGLDNCFDNEQAQPGATNGARGLAWDTMVFGEQSRQLGRWDAHPGVADAEHGLPILHAQLHRDAPALGRVLERVGQQIVEYLPEPFRVGASGYRVGRQVERESLVLGLRLQPHEESTGFHHLAQFNVAQVETQVVSVNLGKVEIIVD